MKVKPLKLEDLWSVEKVYNDDDCTPVVYYEVKSELYGGLGDTHLSRTFGCGFNCSLVLAVGVRGVKAWLN